MTVCNQEPTPDLERLNTVRSSPHREDHSSVVGAVLTSARGCVAMAAPAPTLSAGASSLPTQSTEPESANVCLIGLAVTHGMRADEITTDAWTSYWTSEIELRDECQYFGVAYRGPEEQELRNLRGGQGSRPGRGKEERTRRHKSLLSAVRGNAKKQNSSRAAYAAIRAATAVGSQALASPQRDAPSADVLMAVGAQAASLSAAAPDEGPASTSPVAKRTCDGLRSDSPLQTTGLTPSLAAVSLRPDAPAERNKVWKCRVDAPTDEQRKQLCERGRSSEVVLRFAMLPVAARNGAASAVECYIVLTQRKSASPQVCDLVLRADWQLAHFDEREWGRLRRACEDAGGVVYDTTHQGATLREDHAPAGSGGTPIVNSKPVLPKAPRAPREVRQLSLERIQPEHHQFLSSPRSHLCR